MHSGTAEVAVTVEEGKGLKEEIGGCFFGETLFYMMPTFNIFLGINASFIHLLFEFLLT
jgi:hypothetical protein